MPVQVNTGNKFELIIDWSVPELSINVELLLEKFLDIEEFTSKEEWLLNFNTRIFTISDFNGQYPCDWCAEFPNME